MSSRWMRAASLAMSAVFLATATVPFTASAQESRGDRNERGREQREQRQARGDENRRDENRRTNTRRDENRRDENRRGDNNRDNTDRRQIAQNDNRDGGRGRGDISRSNDRRDWNRNDGRRDWNRNDARRDWNRSDGRRDWNRSGPRWDRYDYRRDNYWRNQSWRWNRPSYVWGPPRYVYAPRYYYRNRIDPWDVIVWGVLPVVLYQSLTVSARENHQYAYNQAMAAPVGETIIWDDSGARGTVQVTRDGYAGDKYCREFQQTITINGREEQGFGTTCQEPDGSWRLVTPG